MYSYIQHNKKTSGSLRTFIDFTYLLEFSFCDF